MTSPAEADSWANRYRQRRANGAPGWAGQDSYALKRQRLSEVLDHHHIAVPIRSLEIGCGAGNTFRWMAGQGHDAVGVDLVPDAIAWAREAASMDERPSRFHCADVTDLYMLADDTFDLVFDGDCLHMIFDDARRACLDEIRRILRPGGLLITGGNMRDEAVRSPITFAHGHCHFDPVARTITCDDGLRFLLATEHELSAELERAGFAIVHIAHHPPRGRQPFIKGSISLHARKE